MSFDLQSDMDNIILGPSNPLREQITGIPATGTQKTLWASVKRYGPEAIRMKSGGEQTIGKCSIVVSKTDWPLVTRKADRFIISMNGSDDTMKVASILYEDSVSFELALV